MCQIDTTSAREAFVAGTTNGLKPLNAAALQYSDQVLLDLAVHQDFHLPKMVSNTTGVQLLRPT